jgi:hypothetical protein
MAQQIGIEAFTQELYQLLDETFNEVHGSYLDGGTSLFETLATVTAAEASRPVSARCASLVAQVDHVRFYLDVLERYFKAEAVSGVDWAESWRLTTATDEEWAGLIQRLRDSYGRVLATMQHWETWNGEDQIGSAMAMLVHSAYHLGEIRQALCTLKN